METTERDLLIRMDQKLTDLCKSNSEAHETFMERLKERETFCNTTQAACNTRFDNKVSTKMFMWTVGSIVGAALTITGILVAV